MITKIVKNGKIHFKIKKSKISQRTEKIFKAKNLKN